MDTISKPFHNLLQSGMLSELEQIAKDESLYHEKNFNARVESIDYIEFHIIDRIDVLFENTADSDQLIALKQYAVTVKNQLEKVNATMFQKIRLKISCGALRGQALLHLMEEFVHEEMDPFHQWQAVSYDNLDLFVNGMLTHRDLPKESRKREPEMVYYQKTPARIILNLIGKAEFTSQDVFIDLGSGLGQVSILVNLISSIITKGVEFEPNFCAYAKKSSADLQLHDVDFIHVDARFADYSTGTVFFMFTPFEGKMLLEVLKKLKDESKKRKIKLFTYGPCTSMVAEQKWLLSRSGIQNGPGAFGEFISKE